jgi:protein-S-isoprenylcysteine O-methyltransferase Ste14
METNQNKAVLKRLAQVLITFFVQTAILFIAAGTVKWLWGWVLFGISILIMVVNSRILPKELISERGNPKANVKQWDKILMLISLFPIFFTYIISGLDQRFSWTGAISLWVHFSGIILMITGNAIFTWAMVSNQFFSTLVRIQDERNHTVATAGPYQIVRHPGYAGFILQTMSTPLLLGTLWALIPAGVVSVLFIIRTVSEDSVLKKELNGYRDYTNKVRYRLIPGIW